MFVPAMPVGETILRGTIIYLALFLLFRFVMRRQAGAFAPSDFLLVLLISEATQNGMAQGARAVTDSLVLITTLAFWDYALDWLALRSVLIRKLVKPPPRILVRDGRVQRSAMRAELMTLDDLYTMLREQGVESLDGVKVARMEPDGQVSVIKREPDSERGRKSRIP